MIVLMLHEDLNHALVSDLLKEAGFKVAKGQPVALGDHSEYGQTLGPPGALQSKACAWPRDARGGSGAGRRSHH
jgi:hypothetical protein